MHQPSFSEASDYHTSVTQDEMAIFGLWHQQLQ